MQPASSPSGPRHLVYNQQTGRILSTYTYLDLASGAYKEVETQEVLDLTEGTVPAAESADGLGVIAVDNAPANVAASHRVDIESQSLLSKYQLQVRAQKAQLNGDGADSVSIEVNVTDEAGAPVTSFEGDLRAVTTRGKFSSPGGRITATGGAATFQLTAAAETVARVRVTVSDPSGRCTPGSADLEFL